MTMLVLYICLWVNLLGLYPSRALVSHAFQRARVGSPSTRLAAGKKQPQGTMTLAELEEYALVCGLRLKATETGPVLRIEAYPAQSPGSANEEEAAIGYLTAFIRPIPLGLFHLDTIQVKNRRQNIGFQRTGYTIEGPGISFIMGSWALVWAQNRGCRTTQLLAVKDSEEMHNVLVRLYESFGFTPLRSVGDESSSIADRLVWGAVGTLMQMDIPTFMQEWSPKLRSMLKMAKLTSGRQDRQALKVVALTREDGANSKLSDLLPDLSCVELPCIAFGPGKDTPTLPTVLTQYDVIIITSPQAASVYLSAWEAAGRPSGLKIATVGKGTSKPLLNAGLSIAFEPSDATAETLAKELPVDMGSRVLYPSSSIAENTLAKGLEARGFTVTKLDTYETVPSTWTQEQLEKARAVDIVTFASPSTVKVWAERVGTSQKAVVIGPTSKKACLSAGWKEEDISCPDGSKGLEAWADLVRKVL